MKLRHALTLILFSILLYAPAQSMPDSSCSKSDRVYTFVEQPPSFPGGDVEMIKFLQENLVYPQMEKDNNIQGQVIIRFIVDESGKILDPTVIKPVSPCLDKEALRVIKKLPEFEPGQQGGKPVKVYFNLPVKFKLKEYDAALIKLIEDKYLKHKTVQNAISLYRNGDFKDAAYTFEKVGDKNRDGLLFALMAECYSKLGDKLSRCKSLEKAATLGHIISANLLEQECGERIADENEKAELSEWPLLTIFPGGSKAFFKYLSENFHYPKMEQDSNIEGEEIIKFYVSEYGIISDVQVIKSVSPGLDLEAIRMVKAFPELNMAALKLPQNDNRHLQLSSSYGLEIFLPLMLKLIDHDSIWLRQMSIKYLKNENVQNGIAAYREHDILTAIKCFKEEGFKTEDGLFFAMIAEGYSKLGDRKQKCENMEKAVSLGFKELENAFKAECSK
jgi:TonB family protein